MIAFFISLLLIVVGTILVFIIASRKKARQIPKEVTYDELSTEQRIKNVLTLCLNYKSVLTVGIEGRQFKYTSYLLAIDLKEKVLIIDKLIPEEGNLLLKDSEYLTVSFIILEDKVGRRNIPYDFNSQFVKAIMFKGSMANVIKLPNKITRRQRREYLRVKPPSKDNVYIFFSIDGIEYKEKVFDISGGGVAFFTGLTDSELKVGMTLKDVKISIPGVPTIETMALIRKKERVEGHGYIDGKRVTHICGAKFVEISNEARDLIIKYVVNVEREELRRFRSSPVAED